MMSSLWKVWTVWVCWSCHWWCQRLCSDITGVLCAVLMTFCRRWCEVGGVRISRVSVSVPPSLTPRPRQARLRCLCQLTLWSLSGLIATRAQSRTLSTPAYRSGAEYAISTLFHAHMWWHAALSRCFSVDFASMSAQITSPLNERKSLRWDLALKMLAESRMNTESQSAN